MKLIAHLRLVLRLRIRGAIPPAARLHGAVLRDNFTFTTIVTQNIKSLRLFSLTSAEEEEEEEEERQKDETEVRRGRVVGTGR